MTSIRFCVLLLALAVAGTTLAQNEDIPIENDNQFPPDDQSNVDGADKTSLIDGEGSGEGTIDEPPASESTSPSAPLLEESRGLNEEITTPNQEDQSCPKSCTCHLEGGTDDFVVDCSGVGLTEFPSPIDAKTTILNIQNNKITEIPKDVATLKNLKELNAANNAIMDLALGSVSELGELKVLKLSNNRLIEYPKDLKNSIDLTKLTEIDLGGNDMRSELSPETFSNFQSLRKITLAKSTSDLLDALCGSLKFSLDAVCTESCDTYVYECPDSVQNVEEDYIPVLPGVLESPTNDNAEPASKETGELGTEETPRDETSSTVSTVSTTPSSGMGRSRLGNNAEEQTPQKLDNIVAQDAKDEKSNEDEEAKVGATTKDTPGGVNKSLIGIVVAAMVVIVAGITIKKNWSSIRKKFSSTPRTADRNGTNANGPTPEEVPLQDKDKSPV